MSYSARSCLFAILLVGLASSCSRPPKQIVAPPAPTPSPPARAPSVFNYAEHELSADKRATIDHEIVLHLEPAEAARGDRLLSASGETVINEVFYRLAKAEPHEFCLDEQDPLLEGLVLRDGAGRELLSITTGEPCATLQLEAGDYTLTVHHDGGATGPRGRKAFVHRANKPRLWSQAADGDGPAPTVDADGGYLAFAGAGGQVYADNAHPHDGSCCTASPDDAYQVTVKVDPAAQLFAQWSLWKVRATPAGRSLANYQLGDANSWDMHGLNPDRCQEGGWDDHLYLQNAARFCSQLYPSSSYYKSWVKLSEQHVTDLGNYQFVMGHTLWSYTDPDPPSCVDWCSSDGYSYEHFQYGTTPGGDHLQASSAAAAPDGFSSTFTVLYRYYDDAAKAPQQLQPGEVAVYTRKSYGGAPGVGNNGGEAWIFVDDTDFTAGLGGLSASSSPDNAVSSIKLGPGTGVKLFADPGYQNLLYEDLYGDVPDLGSYTDPLGKTHSLDNVISSIKVVSLKSVLISTRDCAYCNLTGVDLGQQDLSGVNLAHAILDRASLAETAWEGANLKGASLKHANLSGAQLDLADAEEADFSGANLSSASFSFTSQGDGAPAPGLRRARFSGADLTATRFVGVNLSGADFSHADVRPATFDLDPTIDKDFKAFGATQWRTSFAYGVVGTASFSPATWRYLDLTGAALKPVAPTDSLSFPKTDLRGARITGANLTGLVLDGARFGCPEGGSGSQDAPCIDLSRARFSSASLKGVDLTGATLRGASFTNADLTGATLRGVYADECTDPTSFEGAYLLDADLEGALLNCAKMSFVSLYQFLSPTPPSLIGANFTQAELSGAILAGLDLSGAKLDKANLSGANLVNTSLANASLRSATLSRAFLQGTDLSGANLTAFKEETSGEEQTSGASLAKASISKTAGTMPITVVRQDGSTETDVFAYDATRFEEAITDTTTTCPNTAPSTVNGPCLTPEQWAYPTPETPECVPKPSTDVSLVGTCPRPR